MPSNNTCIHGVHCTPTTRATRTTSSDPTAIFLQGSGSHSRMVSRRKERRRIRKLLRLSGLWLYYWWKEPRDLETRLLVKGFVLTHTMITYRNPFSDEDWKTYQHSSRSSKQLSTFRNIAFKVSLRMLQTGYMAICAFITNSRHDLWGDTHMHYPDIETNHSAALVARGKCWSRVDQYWSHKNYVQIINPSI